MTLKEEQQKKQRQARNIKRINNIGQGASRRVVALNKE
jgi:hypothetical protein